MALQDKIGQCQTRQAIRYRVGATTGVIRDPSSVGREQGRGPGGVPNARHWRGAVGQYRATYHSPRGTHITHVRHTPLRSMAFNGVDVGCHLLQGGLEGLTELNCNILHPLLLFVQLPVLLGQHGSLALEQGLDLVS